MDPWQDAILDDALGERADGTWAAFECGLIVGRQNGKGSVIEARELAGLFLFGEKLILHSAHEFKTSKEHFLRILQLIERNPDFDARVKRISRSHGEEGIELKGGARLLFATRTGGGGRGFSGDLVILDEAYNLSDTHMAALLPTLSARPNPQIWYTSSAPDKDLAPCQALSRVRSRARAGGAHRLAYFEWAADVHDELCPADCDIHDEVDDPRTWAKTNPGLGIRISREYIELTERPAMSAEAFARERLGVGNYVVEGNAWMVIDQAPWEAAADGESQTEPESPLAFAVAVTPDQSYAAIAVAGVRGDDLMHVEITGDELLDHRPGTGWVVPRLLELKERWRPRAIVLDGGGPAGTLVTRCEAAGIELSMPSTREYAQACGAFKTAVVPRRGEHSTVRHRDQAPLTLAVSGAEKRDLADLWAWSRKNASVDISPLEAATLAHWGYGKYAHVKEERSAPWVMRR